MSPAERAAASSAGSAGTSAPSSALAAASMTPVGGPTRILLVEDEENFRDPLAFGLRRDGFEVVEAEDRTDPAATDEVDTALDRMLLGGALSQLSVDHRAVIERAYYRQLSVAQIAAELQIAEGTVKSRLHYAVRALRLNLQEMGVTR